MVSEMTFNDMVQKQRAINKGDYPWDTPYDERPWKDITDFEEKCMLISHLSESIGDRIKAMYHAQSEQHPALAPLYNDARSEMRDLKRYVEELDKILEKYGNLLI